jgi:hypothetical protein
MPKVVAAKVVSASEDTKGLTRIKKPLLQTVIVKNSLQYILKR